MTYDLGYKKRTLISVTVVDRAQIDKIWGSLALKVNGHIAQIVWVGHQKTFDSENRKWTLISVTGADRSGKSVCRIPDDNVKYFRPVWSLSSATIDTF